MAQKTQPASAGTRADFEHRYSRLAPSLQDAMFSPAVAKTIRAIAEKHRIQNLVSILADAIGDVFLGLLHPNLFIRTLAERAELSVDKARRVAMDVSALVFAPVRNELLKMYRIPPSPAVPLAKAGPLAAAPAEAGASAKTGQPAIASANAGPPPAPPKPAAPPLSSAQPSPLSGVSSISEVSKISGGSGPPSPPVAGVSDVSKSSGVAGAADTSKIVPPSPPVAGVSDVSKSSGVAGAADTSKIVPPSPHDSTARAGSPAVPSKPAQPSPPAPPEGPPQPQVLKGNTVDLRNTKQERP